MTGGTVGPLFLRASLLPGLAPPSPAQVPRPGSVGAARGVVGRLTI